MKTFSPSPSLSSFLLQPSLSLPAVVFSLPEMPNNIGAVACSLQMRMLMSDTEVGSSGGVGAVPPKAL